MKRESTDSLALKRKASPLFLLCVELAVIVLIWFCLALVPDFQNFEMLTSNFNYYPFVDMKEISTSQPALWHYILQNKFDTILG